MAAQQRTRSSVELSHEREVLEELLRSEGWKIFVRRVADEWRGDGYFARMGTAVASPDPMVAKVVHAVSLEVERVIQWPKTRVEHLGGKVE